MKRAAIISNRHYWAKNFVLGYQWCDHFLLPSNDTQCLQTNMRISARSENRVSTWITLITHKNRVRLTEESIFRARYLMRVWVIARPPPGLRSFGPLRANIVFLARYCFLRILARFGTRSIQFGRLWPGGVLESPRAVQSNGAFWSMRTGNCVLFAGTRLTNDDDHLHRSPLFIHMNSDTIETLNLLTVQLLLFRYPKSSIDPHEILHSGSVLPAPTIVLIICHSRHFAPLLFF